MTRALSSTTARLTGTALIVLPLVALALKLASAGWMVVAIIWTAPVWLVGYALQIAVAASGYLGGRGALREGTGARRALIAAWATSIAVVLVGFFLVDGGDSGDWGSTFMLAAGLAGDRAASDVSSAVCVVAASVWLAGWMWLVVEWVVALVRRRRAARLVAP
ncbi:hypothetical protein H9651_02490 [Microbacterium sp. Sa4CUA7]|uniref:Uncharacterized protein n=1 Tax=Microbacterium pullorum TaxID=2762236 RepID=A0ABR8RZ54_9MICO|nr:hypothetical protein [Microbacterium pullorum]MBD7956502.1 hypothetical protein [Microbacterium pullorum]